MTHPTDAERLTDLFAMDILSTCADQSILAFMDTFCPTERGEGDATGNARANLAMILATRCYAAAATLDGKAQARQRLRAMMSAFEKWDIPEQTPEQAKRA